MSCVGATATTPAALRCRGADEKRPASSEPPVPGVGVSRRLPGSRGPGMPAGVDFRSSSLGSESMPKKGRGVVGYRQLLSV